MTLSLLCQIIPRTHPCANSSHHIIIIMTEDMIVLRRLYTRTLPKDIRPLHVLSASFRDAREQWFAAMRQQGVTGGSKASSAPSHTSLGLPSLDAVHRIVSQIRSVKAELFHRLHAIRTDTHACLHTSQCPLDALFAATRIGSAQSDGRVFAALAHSSSSSSSSSSSPGVDATKQHDCRGRAHAFTQAGNEMSDAALHSAAHAAAASSHEYREAVCLARRVWVWCVAVALVTADFDLLSTSLSTASELFGEKNDSERVLAAPGGRVAADGATTRMGECECGNRTSMKEAYEMTLFFHGDMQRIHRRSNNNNNNGDDDDDAWLCASTSSPLMQPDAEHIHACALLYSVLVQDAANSAKKLQQWCSDDAYEDNDGRTDCSTHDGSASGNNKAAPTCVCVSRVRDRSGHFRASIATVAQWAACEDYGTIAAYLAAADAPPQGIACVPGPIPHMDESTSCLNVHSASEQSSQTRHEYSPWPAAVFPLLAASPCVKLLLRMMYEFVVRPRWIEVGVHRSFRPVVGLDTKERKLYCGSECGTTTESLLGRYVQVQQFHLQHMSSGAWPLPPSLASLLLTL